MEGINIGTLNNKEIIIKLKEAIKELSESNKYRSSLILNELSKYIDNGNELKNDFYTEISKYFKEVSNNLVEPVTKPKIKINTDTVLNNVAGNNYVKENIKRLVVYPLKYPSLYKKMNKSTKGSILLYGVPGNGKTRIARTLSEELRIPFYEIKCSDVMSRYFGETEERIKGIFEIARRSKSIIFFDEFDAIGSARGDEMNGASNRMVAELLTQIDGFDQNNENIIFMASTNRPDNIDSAFLRPGRFSTLIEVPIPDYDTRYEIIRQEMEDVPTDELFSIDIVASMTDGFNSSDVVSFCDRLKDLSIERTILYNDELMIKTEDIDKVSTMVKSSVFDRDLEIIEKFKQRRI